jgi:hypothetical protein
MSSIGDQNFEVAKDLFVSLCVESLKDGPLDRAQMEGLAKQSIRFAHIFNSLFNIDAAGGSMD